MARREDHMHVPSAKRAVLVTGVATLALVLLGCGEAQRRPETAPPPSDGGGGGREDGRTRRRPNLVIESFEAVVQPRGGIQAHGRIRNVGQARARRATELAVSRIGDKEGSKPELLASTRIEPLNPGQLKNFQIEVPASRLQVDKTLRLRATADATRVLFEGPRGERDNAADVTVLYGPDLAVLGVKREEGQDPARDQQETKEISLVADVRNIGSVRGGATPLKWEARLLDLDAPRCFENQVRIARAIEGYNSQNNTKCTEMRECLPKVVEQKWLPELPRDPGSTASDSWTNYSLRPDGNGVKCTVHGSPDAPAREPKPEDEKWVEIGGTSVDLDPGQAAKDARVKIVQEELGGKLGAPDLAGKAVVVRVTVDPAASLAETDEANNAGSARHQFPNPPQMAELVVWGLSAGWNNQSNKIHFHSAMTNKGNADAPAFQSQWSIAPEPWKNSADRTERKQVQALPGGPVQHKPLPKAETENWAESPVFEWDPMAHAGKLVGLSFEADSGNQVAEFSDTKSPSGGTVNGPDNTMHWNLQLPQERFQPDLAVHGHAWTHDGRRVIRAYGCVHNLGTLDSGPFKVSWTVDGREGRSMEVRNLPPVNRGYRWFEAEFPITDAQRKAKKVSVVFTAHPGRPDKSSENNRDVTNLTVAEGPDLAVTDVQISLRRAEVASGAPDDDPSMIVVTGKVTNVGDEPSEPYAYSIGTDSGGSRDAKEEHGLKPQESRTHEYVMKITASSWGKRYSGFMNVTPAPDPADLNRENNQRKTGGSIFLPPRPMKRDDPRLVVEDVDVYRFSGAKGPVWFKANIFNRGRGATQMGFEVQWWADWSREEKPVKTGRIGYLPPGGPADAQWWHRKALWLRYEPKADDPALLRVWVGADPANIICPYSDDKWGYVEVPRVPSSPERQPATPTEPPRAID
jgi:hypothetical protein